MDQGWIKLHRKLLENALMRKSAYFHLWVTLLLLANHKQTTFIFNEKEQTLAPGQVLTGIDKLRKITRLPRTTIRRILKFLENGTMIGQQVTGKFRIISITNWEKYQASETGGTQSGTQTDLKRTSDGTVAAAYKNDKNEKNDKSHRGGFSDDSQSRMIARCLDRLEAEGVFK